MKILTGVDWEFFYWSRLGIGSEFIIQMYKIQKEKSKLEKAEEAYAGSMSGLNTFTPKARVSPGHYTSAPSTHRVGGDRVRADGAGQSEMDRDQCPDSSISEGSSGNYRREGVWIRGIRSKGRN